MGTLRRKRARDGPLGGPALDTWPAGPGRLRSAPREPSRCSYFLPLIDKQGGPHALPPAAAVLGLIILLAVVPDRQRGLVQAFQLAAAILLFLRVYLVHRQDAHLLAEVVLSHERAAKAAAQAQASAERLRLLASVTSRIKGPTIDERLQAISDAARQVVGGRCAAFGLRTADGSGFAHLATSGMDGSTRARFGGLPQGTGLLAMVADSAAPVRLDQLSDHPGAAAFEPGAPAAG